MAVTRRNTLVAKWDDRSTPPPAGLAIL